MWARYLSICSILIFLQIFLNTVPSPNACVLRRLNTVFSRKSSSGSGEGKLLSDLGIEFSALHLNEGHPAFTQLERIRERVEKGIPFKTALAQVKGTSVFTTHTPVPAGTDIFPPDLMGRYFSRYYPQLGIDQDTFLQLGHTCDVRKRVQHDRVCSPDNRIS